MTVGEYVGPIFPRNTPESRQMEEFSTWAALPFAVDIPVALVPRLAYCSSAMVAVKLMPTNRTQD
jgi:hypothetical protein